MDGVGCPWNATVETLVLEHGFWRHSHATAQTLRCKLSGSWTPCRGGANAGDEGDGYCKTGHRGPLCAVCDGYLYLDKLAASCKDCEEAIAYAATACGAALSVVLVLVGSVAALIHQGSSCKRFKPRNALMKAISRARRLWLKAGMRYKLKLTVGLYQCKSCRSS